MNEWINNPMLKNIDPVKLNLIQKAASQVSGKSGKDLAPIMMALITSANRQKIQFTQEEISLILEILKEGKSKEEQEQFLVVFHASFLYTLIRKRLPHRRRFRNRLQIIDTYYSAAVPYGGNTS